MTGTVTRAGVIGLGWIGESHLADLAGRPGVRITAVCDLDPRRTEETAVRFGARPFTDPAALLGHGEIDAVWICTPPQAHLDPALAAFERGIPVYLEKPVARDLTDAPALVAAAEASGLVCAVGYQWHALDLLETVRAELAGQDIGYLLGHSTGPTTARPWFLDRGAGGGNLLERGSHHIDLARAVAGEVESVTAVASGVRVRRDGGPAGDIDDALTVILHLAGGGIATIAIAWTQDGVPGSYGLEVVASDATLRLALDPDFRLSGVSRGKEVAATAASTPFASSNSRFLQAVAAGDPAAVPCTPRDALATLKVALAGEQALATGRRIEVR